MKLSIIIPVFNEEKTVGILLKKVLDLRINGVAKEVVVVDDGSTDSTESVISNLKPQISNIKFIKHKKNLGKGASVLTGIKNSNGDYIVIQDADLEYNPLDIVKLLTPIINKKAEVVYGTRLKRLPNFKRDERTLRFFIHYVGNRTLSFMTSILYGQWVTDMETCYKVFPRKFIEKANFKSRGFEFEPEITAKLLKSGYKILEIPIKTTPRNYSQGKKLHTIRDGSKAVIALLKYRLIN